MSTFGSAPRQTYIRYMAAAPGRLQRRSNERNECEAKCGSSSAHRDETQDDRLRKSSNAMFQKNDFRKPFFFRPPRTGRLCAGAPFLENSPADAGKPPPSAGGPALISRCGVRTRSTPNVGCVFTFCPLPTGRFWAPRKNASVERALSLLANGIHCRWRRELAALNAQMPRAPTGRNQRVFCGAWLVKKRQRPF